MALTSDSPTLALHSSHPKPLRVLIPIYPDFNTFDANGPIEVLSSANRNSGSTPVPFTITIAAATDLTTSIENVRMARDVSLAAALADVANWDILLLPGGTQPAILGMIGRWKEGAGDEVMALLDAYLKREEGLMLTVCTGSLFLGALGALRGRTATSHWGALANLTKLTKEWSEGMLGFSLYFGAMSICGLHRGIFLTCWLTLQ